MDGFKRIRPWLFKFDPEVVHHLAMKLVENDLLSLPASPNSLPVAAFGKQLSHPIGLAAGFDKDGVAIDQWEKWGFAFVEVGTVTWHPQPGNAKPRLFRYPEQKAIVNRMGFNNEGAEALARRLDNRSTEIPVGANIGKSKITPNNEAAKEYKKMAALLAPRSDYLVVNISSPNTPGLRDLQATAHLKQILDSVLPVIGQTPLLIKISPDLDDEQLNAICALVNQSETAGVIATNTTLARPFESEAGGLSGAPLTQRANETAGLVRRALEPHKTLIAVGGLMSPEDAVERARAGADLLQIYTGWIYEGPHLLNRMVEALISEDCYR